MSNNGVNQQQISIFDMLYEKYQHKPKCRLIELFAGYGSQYLACKYLGLGDRVEHYKICEWATKSIQAYNDIHIRDYTDYSKGHDIDDIVNKLFNYGISMDYNSPMTFKQIKGKGEEWCRSTYNNIIATNNLVNISNVKAADLCITDTDEYDYLMTYSFPCQDLSLAGLGKGMEKGSGTRSGLLWEVERILDECNKCNIPKPTFLLMENVTQVRGQGNEKFFSAWVKKLEELGYSNYIQDMIATDYCIPQTRDRTFMVSILGDYAYNFPQPMKLPIKLKDLLEKDVPEKFYLSDKMIKYISNDLQNTRRDLRETIEQNQDIQDGDYLNCYNRSVSRGTTGTIDTGVSFRNKYYIAVKNATKKGYLKAEDGDGVDISGRMQYHRGTVQKGKAQTLSTMGGENAGVCVKTIGNYSPSNHNASRIVDKTPKVIGGIGEKKSNGGTQYYQQDRIYDNNISVAITTQNNPYYREELRIRKLTPRECFSLMGVKKEDYLHCKEHQSDASLYHLAGDSIVTSVLMGAIGELFHINNYRQKILELIQELKEDKDNARNIR